MRANMYNYDDKLDEQDFEEMCEETESNYVQDLKNKIAILEKALDIACSYNVCFLEECDRLPTHRTCKDCRKDYVLSKATWEIEREKQ